MPLNITLEVPDGVAEAARELATSMKRPLEEVLVEWLDHASASPVESLPDDQVLALCDLQLGSAEQSELSELLERNNDGALSDIEEKRLDELTLLYERALLQKSRALKVAVERSLHSRLD